MTEGTMTNELGFAVKEKSGETSLMQTNEARAVAEVQASYVIAKKFPRNELSSYSKIIDTCKRPFLAEKALYAYPKGGNLVNGPSIRLAEVIAQAWTNISYGFTEISQKEGISVVEAYAVDKENNSDKKITFQVMHVRDTKQGRKKINDAREIYEHIANQASRRIRNCILALIPGDIIEGAVDQIRKTLEGGIDSITSSIQKMILAFDEFGIKVEHLEKRLGHKLDATIPSEIVTLKGIYRSIKDGFASREDYFDIGLKAVDENAEEELKNLLADKAKSQKKEKEHVKDEKQQN